jgi:hypothetical protein
MKAMTKTQSPIEKFLSLSDAQKDAEVERLVALPSSAWHPLTPAQRKQWRRIKRKLGRPMIGAGSKTVAVTIELELLKRADRYAKAHALKRSQMIAEGLRLLMERRTG